MCKEACNNTLVGARYGGMWLLGDRFLSNRYTVTHSSSSLSNSLTPSVLAYRPFRSELIEIYCADLRLRPRLCGLLRCYTRAAVLARAALAGDRFGVRRLYCAVRRCVRDVFVATRAATLRPSDVGCDSLVRPTRGTGALALSRLAATVWCCASDKKTFDF